MSEPPYPIEKRNPGAKSPGVKTQQEFKATGLKDERALKRGNVLFSPASAG